jgi:anti-sigma-K factor RskA
MSGRLSPDERRRLDAATRTKPAAARVEAEAQRQYAAFTADLPDASPWRKVSHNCADTWRLSAVVSPGETFP